MKSILLFVLAFATYQLTTAQDTFIATLDFSNIKQISPYLYGYNQDHQEVTDSENWTIRRLGGNRMSVFNWENGASNSGHDNVQYTNDNRIPGLLGVPWNDKDTPGESYHYFHQENNDAGIASIVTFPLVGWVAADKDGSNKTTPPSNRWDELVINKPSALSLMPNTTDGKVYLDESFNYLIHSFGNSTTENGVKYIALGNEPALWDNTHPNLQRTPPTIAEYLAKIIEAAKMVKTVDPNVKVIVGEFAGINIYDFSNASDWSSFSENYEWFPDLLFDTLKKASDAFGEPLVDIFSFHFYPQHKVDANGDFSKTGTSVLRSSSTTDISRKTRMNFTRSLWDETYIEPSWLTGSKLSGASNMILKRLQASIDTYFPSVKMMIGEFDYGNDNDISHGIGMVDFLGACGQYGVEVATRWDLNPYNGVTYTNSAYQLFQNFDGANNTYGNQSVFSSFDNREKGSVWGSLNEDGSELHLIIINKEVSKTVSFTISHNEPQKTYSFNSNYAFDPSKKAIQNIGGTNINVTNTSTSCTLQPMNAYHLVLNRSDMITNLDKDQTMLMNIEVFPNPVNALVQISSVVGNITLKDLSGAVLITKQNTDHIDIRSLAAGNYLVTITNGGEEFTRKIVKQ